MATSLTISVHDYRSLRKASVHFITAEFARRGTARFFSIGLSNLSLRRGDTRENLVERAGRVERCDDVDCYLWKSLWHPFNLRKPALAPVEATLFALYCRMVPRIPRQWIRDADVILIESGLAAVFAAEVRRLNPAAKLVYLASDDLDVVGAARTIKSAFRRHYDLFDVVRLPSRYLVPGMPHTRNAFHIPHGIDKAMAERRYADPYAGRPACISVGSMLFDRSFFEIAAPLFPDLEFHIIGAGKAAHGLAGPNLFVRPEMAFGDTLGFIQHAKFGVAPYRDADTPRYLIDTSLKLRQFGLFGRPAVCPDFALGEASGRFGYRPGDRRSIGQAIAAALSCTATIEDHSLSWSDVVDRILAPTRYDDTRL